MAAIAWNCSANDRPAILSRELSALHERARFPGGTIGYATTDEEGVEVSGSVAVGLAFRETGESLNENHRLCAGSIGKTFCAAVMLRLVEEGKAALDAPISTWLGGEPWFDRLPNARDITLRHLMNHTSGVPEHVQSFEFRADLMKDPDRVWRPEELVAYILDHEPVFPIHAARTDDPVPGGRDADETERESNVPNWSYADTNYILVGMIIERLTGEPFYDTVRRTILEAHNLGGIVPQDRRDIPNLTGGYVRPGGDLLKVEGDNMAPPPDGVYVINPQFEWTGGGFATTSRDLARWTRLHFGGDMIGHEMMEQMLDAVEARPLGPGERYGLGVQIRAGALGDVLGHGGYFPGYLSETAYYPSIDLALSIQVNTSTISRELNPRALRATLDACASAIAAPSGKRESMR